MKNTFVTLFTVFLVLVSVTNSGAQTQAPEGYVYITPGSFMMGSPLGESGRESDESQHKVQITKGFYMKATEVTQAEYKSVMGTNPSIFRGGNLPVECVSWDDVQIFLRKLNEQYPGTGYRLPTEAEWEYACRAGSTTAYCYGDDERLLEDFAWHISRADSDIQLRPVGQKKPNAWGLYDMHGSVWEWCSDWYGDYPSGSVTDPTGPSSGSFHVNRGGSYFDDARGCRSSRRSMRGPANQPIFLGLRLCFNTSVHGGNMSPTQKDEDVEVIKPAADMALQMVRVEACTFMMGSPESEPYRSGNENLHSVTITQGYEIAKYEVTQGLWESVMGSNPSFYKDCGKDCPVENVSWDDVQTFLQKLNAIHPGKNYRLPTEAEWENACRAGTMGASYSGVLDAMGWLSSNSGGTPHPVGQKQANAWGMYDMHGNVWEWCSDWYGAYPSGSVTDPNGPSAGSDRVFRGGGWNNDAHYCRSAVRGGNSPGLRDNFLGFRVCFTASVHGGNMSPTQKDEDVEVIKPAADMALQMVRVEACTFMMGSPESEPYRSGNENLHSVTITQGYEIAKYEVTQGLWESVMGSNPSFYKDCGKDCPVERVSWDDVQKFLQKLNAIHPGKNYRLPTEAEWENACRAGTMGAYAGALDAMGWFNNSNGVHPVGQKQPNAWGIYDMHGNVSEWCSDWYGDYPSGSVTDPIGRSVGSDRVGRGGSWIGYARLCRSAFRDRRSPDYRNDDLGFRLARASSQ